jgi:hypothetical protein
MQDFEKLGSFYLGRVRDLAAGTSRDELVLYDSRDLVTHAVCVGMTGSGKTGLCIGLLEEAAIDGIPAIVIDPKGDLANLLLAFPELRPEDFRPWVSEDDARRKGISVEEHAAAQATLWRDGLARWGQDGARIRRMLDAAEFAVYTPASDAGLPVSILKSFAPPADAVLNDRELLRERVSATATALLALVGVEADPLQSREHILLATLLDRAWREGRELDLGAIIRDVQAPPVSRIGVLDLESFYPAKERFALAMAFNNLLASPGFEAWMEGEPLDIANLLHTPRGKPRVAIFSIAHLADAERMFFVSLLLNQMVSWMRAQSGTTSLRAILYMDEIFGYFPPTANPPSKLPLLTLLKQARAFGLGVVLATQNPVDLDYKGLSNAGTWFIGRLQTERDKARVLDGLEGAASGAGAGFDRAQMDRILSALGNRVFLLNNVHEDHPAVFETRWTLSYLRGPLTRAEIRSLMGGSKQAAPVPAAPAAEVRAAAARPVLPPEVRQCFLPPRGGGPVVWRPHLIGVAEVRFSDVKLKIDQSREVVLLAPFGNDLAPVDWDAAAEAGVSPDRLETEPPLEGEHEALPAAAAKARSYAGWSKDLVNWIYSNSKIEAYRSAALKQTSTPGESERDFRLRLAQAAREERDRAAEDLRRKYAPRITALEDRIRRARQAAEREAQEAQSQKLGVAVSIGATLLGAFLGRKTVSAATLGRAGTAVRSMGRAYKESQDVARASETLEAMDQQRADLESQFQAEAAALQSLLDPMSEPLETIAIRPKKSAIGVRLLALAWAPYRDGRPAWS